MCFVEPPNHLPGSVKSVRGLVRDRELVRVEGIDDFTHFATEFLTVLRRSAADGAFLYTWMDPRRIYEFLDAGRKLNLELCHLCVLAKTKAGPGLIYRSRHELVCVFKIGSTTPISNDGPNRHHRNRSDLWTYQGPNSIGSDRDQAPASHSTVKPVLMIADAIRDVTRRGDAALDTFMGSGSTIMAAELTGRVGLGADLDPLFVDVTARRLQRHTRADAIHAETGELFDDRARRMNSKEEQHDQQQ